VSRFPSGYSSGVSARGQGSYKRQQKGFELRAAILGAYRRRAVLGRVPIRDGDQLHHRPRTRLLPLQ